MQPFTYLGSKVIRAYLQQSPLDRAVARLTKRAPLMTTEDINAFLDANPEVEFRVLLTDIDYAAYGSNQHEGRLKPYIYGGERGTGLKAQEGCWDRSSIRDRGMGRIPFAFGFRGWSKGWKGGRAFVGTEVLKGIDAQDRSAYCRLWRMHLGQFIHLLKEENRWMETATPRQVLVRILKSGILNTEVGTTVHSGHKAPYSCVLNGGRSNDGTVRLTFTNPDGLNTPFDPDVDAQASPAYAEDIVLGVLAGQTAQLLAYLQLSDPPLSPNEIRQVLERAHSRAALDEAGQLSPPVARSMVTEPTPEFTKTIKDCGPLSPATVDFLADL